MNTDLKPRLESIYHRVKRNFIFRQDVGLESWRMPPPNYDGSQTIKDDCDGFCLACRALLREAGIPSRLVYCEVELRSRRYGHLVVEVQGWILDNLQQDVVANNRLYNYRWLRISGYEPGENWREIVGLS